MGKLMLMLPQNNLKKHHRHLKDKYLKAKARKSKLSKDNKCPKMMVQFKHHNNNSKPVSQQNYDL